MEVIMNRLASCHRLNRLIGKQNNLGGIRFLALYARDLTPLSRVLQLLLLLKLAMGPYCPLLAAGGLAQAENAAAPPLELESRSVVFNYPQTDPYDPTNHYGFNHAPSVATLPDGRLLCTWFSGPFEASVDQVILAAFSSDQGRTWGKAFVLQDEPRASDFDPAFIVDGQRVWCFYTHGRWNRYPFIRGATRESSTIGNHPAARRSEKVPIGSESFHLYARYSDDSGKDWSAQRRIHDSAGCRSNGIRLASGELLLPAHDFQNHSTESYIIRSTDHGKNWQRVGSIVNAAGVDEPTIAQLNNGDILMALRTKDGYLWTCVSKDRGQTWSQTHRQPMRAAAASHNLFRISDGRVILTHDECAAGKRTPLTMRITEDGETWSAPITLAESLTPGNGNDYWSCQVTYPSVCEVPDKVLVIVWAYINMSNAEQYGDIQAARVKVLNGRHF